jgi:hypothetical protein
MPIQSFYAFDNALDPGTGRVRRKNAHRPIPLLPNGLAKKAASFLRRNRAFRQAAETPA